MFERRWWGCGCGCFGYGHMLGGFYWGWGVDHEEQGVEGVDVVPVAFLIILLR